MNTPSRGKSRIFSETEIRDSELQIPEGEGIWCLNTTHPPITPRPGSTAGIKSIRRALIYHSIINHQNNFSMDMFFILCKLEKHFNVQNVHNEKYDSTYTHYRHFNSVVSFFLVLKIKIPIDFPSVGMSTPISSHSRNQSES